MSLTANQVRDGLIEAGADPAVVRKLALDCEKERRDNPDTYRKCPRCYGYHSIRGNFDDLCDPCVKTILEHFPEHPSVPHIRAAMARWSTPR
jgi:hypothetical protein